MFKVIFWKSIWNGNSCDTSTSYSVFKRVGELPFAPSPLMQFNWGLGTEVPKSVCWDFEAHQFVCTMPEEFPFEFREDKFDYKWLVENANMRGWILEKELACGK